MYCTALKQLAYILLSHTHTHTHTHTVYTPHPSHTHMHSHMLSVLSCASSEVHLVAAVI